MPSERPFYDIDPNELGLDNYSFSHYTHQTRRLLERYVLPLLGNRRDVDVLSVGCGGMFESQASLRTFPQGRYFGIDINDQNLSNAKMVGVITEEDELNGRVTFAVEDASSVDPNDNQALMNRKWNLIWGRNIKFIERTRRTPRADAINILDNSIQALDTGGVLVLTHFNPDDRRTALKTLRMYEQEGKIEILVDGVENPYLSYGSELYDCYISIIQRQ